MVDPRGDGRRRSLPCHRIIATGLVIATALPATAQIAPEAPAFGDRWQSVPAKPASPAAEKLPVGISQALYLIRSTLLTLNDANRSGNYAVLRDLAAPDFQAKNSVADLSESFADLRHRKFDLYAAALIAPQMTLAPAMDGRGMLRLTGLFPTRPQVISFDLLFENIGGQWRLYGISVATPPAPPLQTQPAAPAKPPAAAR